MLQVFDSNAGELGPTLFNEYGLTYLRLLAYGVKERLTEQNIEHVPMVRNLADDFQIPCAFHNLKNHADFVHALN